MAGLATASLQVSADRFAALRDEEGFELRETAAYLVVECFFDAEEYAGRSQGRSGVVAPVSQWALCRAGPRYTLGWAWFYQEE